jgi:hypothetical protein
MKFFGRSAEEKQALAAARADFEAFAQAAAGSAPPVFRPGCRRVRVGFDRWQQATVMSGQPRLRCTPGQGGWREWRPGLPPGLTRGDNSQQALRRASLPRMWSET